MSGLPDEFKTMRNQLVAQYGENAVQFVYDQQGQIVGIRARPPPPAQAHGGGKRRKSRKSSKSRKSHKKHKHSRRH